MLTDRQIEYRAYLQTEHWKSKRKEALSHYGCICSKCNNYGNDVHHLTYERLWGERLSDLQVLCRDCHYAVHRAQNSRGKSSRAKKDSSIHRQAIFRIMSGKQKKLVCDIFSLSLNSLNIKLGHDNDKQSLELVKFCVKLLGKNSFYTDNREKRKLLRIKEHKRKKM